MTDSDRLPPQDLGAEQATLGAMLMEAGAVARARQILTEADFYRVAHQQVFAAISTVADAGDPVDVTTVAAVLRQREQLAAVGGGEYLTRLIGEVPTTAHVIRYATIVRECAMLRDMIRAGGEIVNLGYQQAGAAEALAAAQARIAGLMHEDSAEGRTMQFAGGGLGDDLQRDLESPPGIGLVRSGIAALDKRTGGLGGHSAVVPMADTKHGKSILANQYKLTTARQFRDHAPGTYVLSYVLEAYEVWRRRAIAWLGRFDSNVFRTGSRDKALWAQVRAAYEEARGLPLIANGRLSEWDRIEVDARNMLLAPPPGLDPPLERIGLVVIDHAQRLEGGGDEVTRYEYIGRRAEKLANDLGAPIILPSQMTTGKDGRSYTKWSRAIEENASLVIKLERGDPDEPPEVQTARNWGRMSGHRTRLSPVGELEYYVDVGGVPGCHADLRMYDEEQWVAEGFPTREQQLQREQVDAQRGAGYAGA